MTSEAGGGGFFLVLEGAEGVGKTTQARLISSWLEGRGLRHTLAREPGGTEVGEAIRKVLLDVDGGEIPPETELLLMLASRAAFVRNVVRPALERGEIMVADRFELSTFAYQAIGRGLGLEEVRQLNAFATGGLHPDLTLVLDLPVEEGRRRQHAAGKVRDRIEDGGDAFLARVCEAYRKLAEEDSRVVLVDAAPPAETVQQGLQALLESRLPEPVGGSRG